MPIHFNLRSTAVWLSDSNIHAKNNKQFKTGSYQKNMIVTEDFLRDVGAGRSALPYIGADEN